MVSPLPLMAASLLLGQTGPTTVSPTPAPPARTYYYNNGAYVPNGGTPGTATIISETPAESRRPFLSRIQGWFGRRNNGTNGSTVPPAYNTFPTETAPPPVLGPSPAPLKGGTILPPVTSPTSTDMPRRMPLSKTGTPLNSDTITPASLRSLPTPVSSPILPANVNRIGRDEKFEWVTGQLEVEKGQYVLYYATPETVDPHHGRILVNAQQVDLRRFQRGDLISARGTLRNGPGAPIYLLTSADLIEKAKR